jgi:hypothetical protein
MPRLKLGKSLPPIKDVPPPTEAEIALLVSQWDTFAQPKYRGMLSARPLGTKDETARWFYDVENRRYVSRKGREVTPKELRAAYLAFHKAMNKR